MKNEKKNEKKNETNVKAEEMLELKVVRELIDAKTKSGENMYIYILREKTVVNGQEREIRVDFSAKDLGGYEMLDIIFMMSEEAFLSVSEETMVDEQTKKKTTYKVYEIWNMDDDGIVYSYKVKPSRESDKSKLDFILQKRALAYERAREKAEAASPAVDIEKPNEG